MHGRVDTSKKLTEFVECLGSETSIHDCRVTLSANSNQHCKLTEVIKFAQRGSSTNYILTEF